MNDNMIVARFEMANTVTGEKVAVDIPAGIVRMLAEGRSPIVIAMTWLIVSPTTCPKSPEVALAAIKATADEILLALAERDAQKRPANPNLN